MLWLGSIGCLWQSTHTNSSILVSPPFHGSSIHWKSMVYPMAAFPSLPTGDQLINSSYDFRWLESGCSMIVEGLLVDKIIKQPLTSKPVICSCLADIQKAVNQHIWFVPVVPEKGDKGLWLDRDIVNLNDKCDLPGLKLCAQDHDSKKFSILPTVAGAFFCCYVCLHCWFQGDVTHHYNCRLQARSA